MDNDLLFETIKDLRHELKQVDHAICQVEAILEGRVRRGRPPKSVAQARAGAGAEESRLHRGRRRTKPDSGDNVA